MNKVKVVFLYTELAEYFVACLRELAGTNCEIHLFRWPLNEEAPFKFSLPKEITLYTKVEDFDESNVLKVVEEITPNIIFCSGWIDKAYVNVCKKYSGKVPTVLLMDNQWENSIKKRVATLIGKFYLKRIFSKVWVPGKPQFDFAKKLGYNEDEIRTGFYSADVPAFKDAAIKSLEVKSKAFPKVLLYVGRYVKHKGIFDLWKAFVEVTGSVDYEWELWCVGTGDQFENRVIHPRIKHFGFVQPNDFSPIIEGAGVYILPSHFEPWGVTVHEFAASAMPLLCSNKVGAATEFVEEGRNGFMFESGSHEDLKRVLYKTFEMSDNELYAMSEYSAEKAQSITPKKWVKTLRSFI